jgi:hypothetical protein
MRNVTVALAINGFLGGPAIPPTENIAAGRWTRGEVDVPARATRRCKVDIHFTYSYILSVNVNVPDPDLLGSVNFWPPFTVDNMVPDLDPDPYH